LPAVQPSNEAFRRSTPARASSPPPDVPAVPQSHQAPQPGVISGLFGGIGGMCTSDRKVSRFGTPSPHVVTRGAVAVGVSWLRLTSFVFAATCSRSGRFQGCLLAFPVGHRRCRVWVVACCTEQPMELTGQQLHHRLRCRFRCVRVVDSCASCRMPRAWPGLC